MIHKMYYTYFFVFFKKNKERLSTLPLFVILAIIIICLKIRTKKPVKTDWFDNVFN
jgi:hypothetical protein